MFDWFNWIAPPFARLYPNPNWQDASQIPDLHGKTAVVLGANVGLGYETALQLARKAAKVYVTARSAEKAEDTQKRLEIDLAKEGVTGVDIVPIALPLDDLKEVKKSAQQFLTIETKVDILVNNAGVLDNEFKLTKDGIESHFAINYLSHFIWTTTLLPIVSQRARIVNVTSYAQTHGKAHFDLEKINDPKLEENNTWMKRYAHSKFAQVLFTRTLQTRVSPGVYVNCCHPGQVNTGLNRSVASYEAGIQGYLIRFAERILGQSASVGALTQLYLATSPKVKELGIKGEYLVAVAKRAMNEVNPGALDDELGKKFWIWTEEILKEKLSE
ncbi:NAD(P)-binding protein [Rhizodiscina lignyota]|uniref:NAD(P)-binding protein n=1 Tax=Rhizodiscina lignyota TaxID=1504668 RepID=A0A9P4M4M1_9PEZI|nr:NAD(P)-binding protein [Rhizodiscina lignyota]